MKSVPQAAIWCIKEGGERSAEDGLLFWGIDGVVGEDGSSNSEIRELVEVWNSTRNAKKPYTPR